MKEFSISKRESVKENINRILLGQIDYILEHCHAGREDMHASIHEIRKSIKRIRAVLRLIREEIGYSTYYRENIFYRDINRSISDLRTSNVLVLTLETMKTELKIRQDSLNPLIESVKEQRETLLSGLLSVNSNLRELSELFLEGRERIPELPVQHDGFRVFAGGLHRMYSQSRDYLDAARNKHDMHHLHDMRKRMKYLWYQVQILKPIYPVQLKAFSDALESITENLGIYHDLEVLSAYLQDNVELKIEEGIQETLLDACKFKKAALLPGILREAGPAFTEEPGALVHRMNEYWEHYHRQTV